MPRVLYCSTLDTRAGVSVTYLSLNSKLIINLRSMGFLEASVEQG